MEPREWIESTFTRLRGASTYRQVSPVDQDYNCVALAASDTDRWWWPAGPFGGGTYWPAGAPNETTIAAFIAAFESLGYVVCADGAREPGYEKVAIYHNDGEPTHAARQHPELDAWLSKLGMGYDIEHDHLDGVGGEAGYGEVAVFLRRPRE